MSSKNAWHISRSEVEPFFPPISYCLKWVYDRLTDISWDPLHNWIVNKCTRNLWNMYNINFIWSPLSKHFFFCCSIVLPRQWCVLQFFLKPQGYVYNLLNDFWHIKQNTDKPIIFLSKAIIILNCHINDTSANFSCASKSLPLWQSFIISVSLVINVEKLVIGTIFLLFWSIMLLINTHKHIHTEYMCIWGLLKEILRNNFIVIESDFTTRLAQMIPPFQNICAN